MAGGSILHGILRVDQVWFDVHLSISRFINPRNTCATQEIEIRPGIVTKDSDGQIQCHPIYSRVLSLFAESNTLQYAVPGGLIGLLLSSHVHTQPF